MPFLHLRKKCRPESANANWLRNLSDNEFSLILPKILSCIYRRKMCDKGIQQMSSLPSLSSYIPITTIERKKRKDPSACFVKDVWQSIGYRQLCTAWFDESALYYNSYLQIYKFFQKCCTKRNDCFQVSLWFIKKNINEIYFSQLLINLITLFVFRIHEKILST